MCITLLDPCVFAGYKIWIRRTFVVANTYHWSLDVSSKVVWLYYRLLSGMLNRVRRILPAERFVWFCQFHCFSSRICHLFEHNPPVPNAESTYSQLRL